MANKAKKSANKNLIYGICAAVVVVVVAIVLVLTMSKKPLDDSFFVSDGTKYVLTMDSTTGMMGDDLSSEYLPEKINLVYFYSGDKITDLKMYYKYENAETVKNAADYLKSQETDDIADIKTEGNYVIVTANKSTYEEMTADDAKQQVELMKMLQNMSFDEEESSTDTTESEE